MNPNEKTQSITRLQLGTSRLEYLDPNVLPFFLDKSWMHLGEPERTSESLNRPTAGNISEIFKKYSLGFIIKRSLQKLFNNEEPNVSESERAALYQQTNFEEFNYTKGDQFPFESNSIDFIYSEHFFEHLFFDEASALLQECYRMLKPNGVIRTSVPDADLRTYLPPEPVGFPDIKLAQDDPSKHKTRWSVYSFEEVLRFAGYEPFPIHYCDKFGKYVQVNLQDSATTFEACPEKEMLLNLDYIKRPDSLIIDGIKRV